jgi:hypothetical protein
MRAGPEKQKAEADHNAKQIAELRIMEGIERDRIGIAKERADIALDGMRKELDMAHKVLEASKGKFASAREGLQSDRQKFGRLKGTEAKRMQVIGAKIRAGQGDQLSNEELEDAGGYNAYKEQVGKIFADREGKMGGEEFLEPGKKQTRKEALSVIAGFQQEEKIKHELTIKLADNMDKAGKALADALAPFIEERLKLMLKQAGGGEGGKTFEESQREAKNIRSAQSSSVSRAVGG